MDRSLLKAHLAVMTAVVIWATSFIALKVAIGEVAPMVVVFFRMLIGSLAFLVVWPWIRNGINYQAGDWKLLSAMALLEPCLYFIVIPKPPPLAVVIVPRGCCPKTRPC